LLIRVAVPVPSLDLLTYAVPDGVATPCVGARVVVPLGTRLVTGIVDNLHHYEKWIAVGVLLVAALILWLRWHGARRTQG